jgi:hypothetical protein
MREAYRASQPRPASQAEHSRREHAHWLFRVGNRAVIGHCYLTVAERAQTAKALPPPRSQAADAGPAACECEATPIKAGLLMLRAAPISMCTPHFAPKF